MLYLSILLMTDSVRPNLVYLYLVTAMLPKDFVSSPKMVLLARVAALKCPIPSFIKVLFFWSCGSNELIFGCFEWGSAR